MRASSKGRRPAKRYVLFQSDEDLTEGDLKQLAQVLSRKDPKAKVIAVAGSPRAVIVRTTNEVAPGLRDREPGLSVRGKTLASVLTSGAIGKLKRRAALGGANGQVHERRIRRPGPGSPSGGSEVG